VSPRNFCNRKTFQAHLKRHCGQVVFARFFQLFAGCFQDEIARTPYLELVAYPVFAGGDGLYAKQSRMPEGTADELCH
jgi:hypothetical protein